MTNREHLGKMALIDLIMELRKTNNCLCFLRYKRCEQYYSCYDCLVAWLNEESER